MCRDKVACKPGNFACRESGACVALAAVCNGANECSDGSDEEGCPDDKAPDTVTQCDEVCCELFVVRCLAFLKVTHSLTLPSR